MEKDELDKLDFDYLLENEVKLYWILDGRNSAYELREEIKSWGGFWVPEHKAWCIETTEKSFAYSALNSCGLILQYRREK